ncbi:MAG: hypothetical protein K5664_03625 [Firmicutes bacterium]|nr:hypothetical protein [Bacillota bacterium]
MAIIKVDFNRGIGKIKPMHAVNNGPIKAQKEQKRSNFDAFAEAKIPYVRNHDASFCSSYGGEHIVDVHAIFPDFTKNPYAVDSYDFALTDDYLNTIKEAGSEIFYRLGTKIEHLRKKYGTIPPADFNKWAVVCEHIIRHYNEGWANGFNLDITYWEIWNEADGVALNGDTPNWAGTPEEYYELYKVTAKHLKRKFPHLKIGGPALSDVPNEKWLEDFFVSLTENGDKTPLDFFSWHQYFNDPWLVKRKTEYFAEKLKKYGYADTEIMLNEYNYLEDWSEGFVSTIKNIISIKGAAFTSAVMAVGQQSLDMLMYYDARPCVFNGLFDIYTMEPLKGYYPFLMFAKLYELQNYVYSQSDDEDVYVVAASNGKENKLMVTYYAYDEKNSEEVKNVIVNFDGAKNDKFKCSILDDESTMKEESATINDGKIILNLKRNSVIFIESI